jgi:hypothetical protein
MARCLSTYSAPGSRGGSMRADHGQGHDVAIVVLASGELAEFGLIATPSYQGTPAP